MIETKQVEEIDKTWIQEAEKRIEEIEKNEIQTISKKQVFQELNLNRQ
ncbi:addiction module protein [Crocosphaera sp. UHCC 0190]|nr:addiction module protein [Crocosphaera sp. UHCC 0190]MEA5508763.1 addiction module protein [Crocosphaera sp. UHCC 0190]